MYLFIYREVSFVININFINHVCPVRICMLIWNEKQDEIVIGSWHNKKTIRTDSLATISIEMLIFAF